MQPGWQPVTVGDDQVIHQRVNLVYAQYGGLVDANGIQPTKVGAIPSHLAAMMQTNP